MSTVYSAKKKIGRPKVDSEAVNVRVERPMLGALDAYIIAQPDPKPSRPEAIRALLREGLGAKGLMQVADDTVAIEERIEVLEAKVAGIPELGKPSPETGMNTMKRALAEAELIGLRRKRKRVRKAKSRDGEREGA